MSVELKDTKGEKSVTKSLTMVEAIRDGMKTMLELDDRTMVLGEDVGVNGGVFRATEGLFDQFGEERIVDTPLSESGIIGTAVGLAVNGFRPIAEMQFMGFVYPAYDQITSHVSRVRTRSMGRYSVPMVIRAPYGAGIRAPEVHSDSAEALFTHMPGIKVVCPSNPYEAKGLLIAAIEDPDPVLFMEPMRSYRTSREDVPTGKYMIDIGRGNKIKKGADMTLIAWGAMIPIVKQVASKASEEGISCEIIDLRTLYPMDHELIAESVQKTGRAVVVHEAHATSGLGNDIVSTINDTSFLYLKAPVARVAGFDVPVPFFALEDHYIPTPKRVLAKVKEVLAF